MGRWHGSGTSLLLPAIDVSEFRDAFAVSAKSPALAKEDIHDSIHDEMLMIYTDRQFDQRQEWDGQLVRQK